MWIQKYCPIPHQIIEKDSEESAENDHTTDFHDETEDCASTNSPGKSQDPPNHPKIFLDPDSTCKEDEHLYCPRTFPEPSVTRLHEECHIRDLTCKTCGQHFSLVSSLIDHMISHQRSPVFKCSFPGCAETFKSADAQRVHYKNHWWNDCGLKPRILRKNPPLKTSAATKVPEGGSVFLENQDIGHQTIAQSMGESSVSDQNDKSSKNTMATSSTDHMKSRDPAEMIPCSYPGCPRGFNPKLKLCVHNTIHSAGLWNATAEMSGTLRKNPTPEGATSTIMRVIDDGIGSHPVTDRGTEESSTTDQNHKSYNKTAANNLKVDMKSRDPSQVLSCSYPACPRTFSSKLELWIHQPTHAAAVWNATEEMSEMLRQNQSSQKAPLNIMAVIGNECIKEVPLGQPFIGGKPAPLLITTGPRKAIATEIIPYVHPALHSIHSPSPHKIQLDESPTPDRNIPRGSETGAISPGETELFVCGICEESFGNFDTLDCHMLTTHAGSEESQAEDMEEVSTPADNSFDSVQSSSKRDQASTEGKENQATSSCHLSEESQAEQLEIVSPPNDKSCESVAFKLQEGQIPVEVEENQATSNLPENLKVRTQQKGPVPRYPIIKIGDTKYFCCGFPGCNEVFNNVNKRYKHHKKYHDDAPRSMFTYLPEKFSAKKDNEASCTQLEEDSHKEKKTNQISSTQPQESSDDGKQKERYIDGPPDFPFVLAKGKKYFWCDVPICGIVNTNLEARYLHHKKHQISSAESTTVASENFVGPDSKKPKISKKDRKQFQDKPAGVIERNNDEILVEKLPPNEPEISDWLIQDDEEVSAQSPEQVLFVVLDEDFEVNEQEVSCWHDLSMDTLQFIVTDDDDSLMEHISLINEDFIAENIEQTDC